MASFSHKKGQRVLVEAMRILKDRGIIGKVFLTLIGDGPLKKEIFNLTEQYDLKEFISFFDHVSYEALHEKLLEYHLFVHPSLTTEDGDCEGGALVVLLDAQATGMPVISTFHCDIPEEVIHEKTGLLVPEADSEALAEAVLQFSKRPGLLTEFGIAARKHVERSYSAKNQAERLDVIYSDLIRV